jgi:hypothetical protein
MLLQFQSGSRHGDPAKPIRQLIKALKTRHPIRSARQGISPCRALCFVLAVFRCQHPTSKKTSIFAQAMDILVCRQMLFVGNRETAVGMEKA